MESEENTRSLRLNQGRFVSAATTVEEARQVLLQADKLAPNQRRFAQMMELLARLAHDETG